jgi:acyl-CoA thioesterase FadM
MMETGAASDAIAAPAFIHPHYVAFVEADPAGIAHFSRYPLWVEEAENAYWHHHGHPHHHVENNRLHGWPRTAFTIRHLAPVYPGQTIHIALTPQLDLFRQMLTWHFRIIHPGRVDQSAHPSPWIFARGQMQVIYATIDPLLKNSIKKHPIPPQLLAHLA